MMRTDPRLTLLAQLPNLDHKLEYLVSLAAAEGLEATASLLVAYNAAYHDGLLLYTSFLRLERTYEATIDGYLEFFERTFAEPRSGQHESTVGDLPVEHTSPPGDERRLAFRTNKCARKGCSDDHKSGSIWCLNHQETHLADTCDNVPAIADPHEDPTRKLVLRRIQLDTQRILREVAERDGRTMDTHEKP